MFSLLNPIGLWLGAALAIPLAIHFLGRQRLRKQPFPSLLLLQEKLSKSMHRHRLKNILLLLLRTLLILSLLLALAKPALETHRPAAAPEAAYVLLHNGAYGLLRSEDAAAPGTALQGQLKLIRGLDSAVGKKSRVIPLLADGPGLNEAVPRLGDYGEAVSRLLSSLGGSEGAVQVHLPVFAWADALPAKAGLEQALRDHPGLQLVLWDFGGLGERLSAFGEVKAQASSQAPTVKLLARLNPAAAETKAGKVQTYVEKSLFQEGAASGITEVTLPLNQGARTWGRLALAPAGTFAAAEYHFCFPNPGRLTMAHAGSALASLPSLGRENYFRRIVHVGAAKDLPWGPQGGPEILRLVYLSDEKTSDAAVYGRIVEFVKRGGRLIIGVGRESEIPMLNRFLLQPLRLGRLGDLAEASAARGAVEANRGELARLGAVPETGPLGAVRKRFTFAADSGAAVLLSQAKEPILVERDFHQGKVLLWTTDIDDLDWSDLGIHPITPLLHQVFQESGAAGMTAEGAASDSVYTLTMEEAGARPAVVDPEGRPFTRVRIDGARLRIGPFDKLGLHRVITGRDTQAFAVNLAKSGPSAAKAGDWGRWNEGSREEFLKGLEAFKDRVRVTFPESAADVRAAVRPLWKFFFLAAILLLFFEGLVSAALRRR
jgi:hypothetical protein